MEGPIAFYPSLTVLDLILHIKHTDYVMELDHFVPSEFNKESPMSQYAISGTNSLRPRVFCRKTRRRSNLSSGACSCYQQAFMTSLDPVLRYL